MPAPSRRDLERQIEKIDPEPDEVDDVKVWEAFILGEHPKDMDTLKEADAVRKLWTMELDDVEAADLDDKSDAWIEEFDRQIREFEGYDGEGRPY